MLIQGILIFTLLNESLCKISSNMIIYKINRNEHNHRYDIPINIKEIKFSCSFGTKWFIPSTIPKQLQPIIEVNTNQTQSMLYIQLPENNSLHVNYRGLYQCCQTFNKDDIGKLNWLPYEPFCCPCCPWYEQNNCLFKQIQLNNSTNIILKLKNASFYCGSAFLYTNTINTETIYLHVLRNQPMLIPCPGLNTTFKSKEITTFSIDYQLTPHKSSKQLWYPFKQLNQFNSILYYYDNRFGLCLIKSQFPRIMLFMLCNYKQIHQQRIIQPIWSLTSPVIPPTIHLYLQSINTVDYNTHQLIDNNNNSVYFLKNINWFIKYTDDIITFRIMKHITMLQLTCIGSYSQKYIVQKPIDKLCFTWRLLNEINEIPTDIYEFRKHDQFDNQSMQTRTECLSTHQTFNKLPILFAYSNYHHIYNHFHSYQLKLSQSSTSPSLLSSSYDSSKQYKSVEHMLGELLGLTTNDTTNIKTTPTTTTTTTPMKTTINHSINQINKWIIPRKFIKLSNYSLGFGHYGSVYKAWLSSSYIKDKLNNQFNDILLKENIDKYIVAIKASSSSLVARQNIHHDNNNNNNNLLCLRNEIRILTNLTNCENIIKMIGIMFEHKLKTSKNLLNNVNLILEYCQYKSLSHFIQYHSYQITNSLFNYEEIQCNKVNTIHDSKIIEEYQLTVKELYRFAYGIISGIVYLTRNYVIHRDLATRNILINHNYIPKISDFGLAVQLTPLNALINDSIYNYDDEFNEDQLIDEYYRVLTPRKKLPLRILPPEALLQHKFYFSSDIWQYGLLIWELFHLERREPFQEIKTFQELISVLTDHNHNSNKNNSIHCNSNLLEHTLKTTMNCQLSLPPSTLDRPILVNDELWEIMCQMWSYNPQNRPTAVQVNDKLKCLYDNIVGKSNLIDFHYICHEHQHHENHNCSHENCLSISSFTETHNHSVHRYENTNEST
ncbi:hypothetical protein MN116_004661 [Schistosoma mekongi]|uniref:Protein kinase domain-containing protein n=1 Tax=Schistosoma mekongi TaxID=38744 RepID=A0AAE1ZCF1_SCHME|nr:hypothetical protein MN116_004661 [Schistosoma mekongi]